MEKKYKLTDKTLEYKGHILHRIVALRSFGEVREGDFGGYVESYDNLSQMGDCWVFDEAKAMGNSQISEEATLRDYATIMDKACMSGRSHARGYSEIKGRAMVTHEACISWHATVKDNAFVCGCPSISDNAVISCMAFVGGTSLISGNALVTGGCTVENACVRENANVCGSAKVLGPAVICGNAVVRHDGDYMVFKNFWSSGRYFTYTRSNKKWRVGCFYGTGEELIAKAYKDSKTSGYYYERIVRFAEEMGKSIELD